MNITYVGQISPIYHTYANWLNLDQDGVLCYNETKGIAGILGAHYVLLVRRGMRLLYAFRMDSADLAPLCASLGITAEHAQTALLTQPSGSFIQAVGQAWDAKTREEVMHAVARCGIDMDQLFHTYQDLCWVFQLPPPGDEDILGERAKLEQLASAFAKLRK